MRRVTPTALALAGVVAVIVGAGLTMAFAVAQTSCQNGPGGLVPSPALANHCGADGWGTRIGFVVLVVGGLLVLLAGVRATPRYRGTGGSSGSAAGDPDNAAHLAGETAEPVEEAAPGPELAAAPADHSPRG